MKVNNFFKDFKQLCNDNDCSYLVEAYNNGLITLDEAIQTILDIERKNAIEESKAYWGERRKAECLF